MLFRSGESLVNALDTLKEIQEYINTDGTVAETVTSNAATIATLISDKDTVGSVAHSIATQAAIDASTYATQAALAEVKATADEAAVKSEVDAELADKIDSAEITHTSTGVVEGVTKEGTTLKIVVDAFTKEETLTKIDEKITTFTGGESAADVKNALDTYKETNDAAIAALQATDETHSTAIQTHTNAIAAINDANTGILAQAQAYTDLNLQPLTKTVAEHTTAITENTANIASISAKIDNTNDNVTVLSTKVGTLEGELKAKDATLEAEIGALRGTHNALAETVNGNIASIKVLEGNVTTMDAAIAANTANFSNYLTTDATKKAIDDKIAEIGYTDLKAAVTANTTAISAEASRADTEEKRLAGLIQANADNIAVNTSAISANEANIAGLEAAINAVIENEDGTALNSIKELALWVEEHESEVLPQITNNTKAIAANADAISLLNSDDDTKEGSIKKAIKDAFANFEIPVATSETAGLVKASGEVAVDAYGSMSIVQVSTDKLTLGSDTLVLNGGKATTA